MIFRRLFSSVSSIKLYGEKPVKESKELQNYSMPRPHAIRMNEVVSEVITYKIKNRPLTPLYEVPIEARISLFPYFESPANSRLLKVAVIGAPNAGKTSLINSILGKRVLSVSRKVNTTYDVQEAIKTRDNTQLIFYDTPGIISTHAALTNKISSKGWEVLPDTDLTLLVVDAAKILRNDVKSACTRLQELLKDRGESSLPEGRIAGETHAQYEQRLKQAPVKIPAYLVINKVDLVEDRRRVKRLVNELKDYACFSGEFFVSASNQYNVEQLEEFLIEKAVENEWEHHPMQSTSLSDCDVATDIVREQVLHHIHDELPYRWIYRVVGWTPHLDGTLRIDVDIQVKTDIHKGILTGREGMVIKKIIHAAESTLSNYYQRKIRLVIRASIMGDEERKASYKGRMVKLAPPHSVENVELSEDKMKDLRLLD